MAEEPCYNERAFHHIRGKATLELQYSSAVKKRYTLASTKNGEPVIPNPSLFAMTSSPGEAYAPNSGTCSSWDPPSVAQCAVHLEFLNVLHVLKHNVLADRNIARTMGYSSNKKPLRATLEEWKQRKWTKYVDFAVLRFLAWARHVNGRHDRVARMRDIENKESLSSSSSSSRTDKTASGPTLAPEAPEAPLDVLMVWAAMMLDPVLYRKHFGKQHIYQLPFPWEAVHARIDDKQSWLYKHHKTDAATMEQMLLPQNLHQQFRQWPFPKEQRAGHQYPGLSRFEFGMGGLEDTNGDDKAHDETIRMYVDMFRKMDVSLGKKLRSGVIRQDVFASKMADLMWIRSPGIKGTLRRAIDRYGKFMQLTKLHKESTLVPAQDIDLVWRTHLCAGGAQYAKDMEAHIGRLVHPKDSPASKAPDWQFTKTRQLFSNEFGQEYRICGCWDCEYLIGEMEQVVHLDVDEVDMRKIANRARETLLFHRAVEIMRRSGEPLPILERDVCGIGIVNS